MRRKKETVSGIYRIVCVKNGRYYFGSSVDVKKRWRGHLRALCRGIHYNQHLQRIFDKYGEAALRYELVEIVPKDKLLDVEDTYLAEHVGKPNCLNVLKTSRGTGLGKNLSEEACVRLSKAHLGQVPWNKGLTMADPRVSASIEGMAQTRWTENGKKEFAERRKGSGNPMFGRKWSAERLARHREVMQSYWTEDRREERRKNWRTLFGTRRTRRTTQVV